jgi:hypothetical protein
VGRRDCASSGQISLSRRVTTLAALATLPEGPYRFTVMSGLGMSGGNSIDNSAIDRVLSQIARPASEHTRQLAELTHG